jgi:3-methyl-2-oxobutanoate hydroxymethyltransferase
MRTSITQLQKQASAGEKLVMLTCYDASFAGLCETAGVDILLIGDSLGMVIQGRETTHAVTLAETEYHVACVARGCSKPFILADMPFGSFQESKEQAFRNAARLIAAGAQMVKLEGGAHMVETTRFLVDRGVPVCSHIGLTPQSVYTFGGFKVQGRGEEAAARLVAEAKLLDEAGSGMILMEAVPSDVGARVTAAVKAPTIGIGAGLEVSGQVLVLYDILDLYPGKKARFVKNFMAGATSVQGAIEAYVKAVKARTFPGPEHQFPAEAPK